MGNCLSIIGDGIHEYMYNGHELDIEKEIEDLRSFYEEMEVRAECDSVPHQCSFMCPFYTVDGNQGCVREKIEEKFGLKRKG